MDYRHLPYRDLHSALRAANHLQAHLATLPTRTLGEQFAAALVAEELREASQTVYWYASHPTAVRHDEMEF